MKIVTIFILGLGILVGALIINTIAAKLGLMSWFTFVKNPSSAGTPDYLWLFILYPLFLGVIAYYTSNALNLF